MASNDHTDGFGEAQNQPVKPKHPCDTYIEKLETIAEHLEFEILPALRIIKAATQGLTDSHGHALLLQAVINRINDLAGDIDFSK